MNLERKNFENILFFYGARLKRVMNGENLFRLFTRNERVTLVRHGILRHGRGFSEMHLTDKARELLERT